MTQHLRRKALLSTIAALGLVGATFAPAAAAKGRDAAPGQAGKADAAAAGWTEDNDTNDGNTPNDVVDDGDNRHPSGKDRSVERGGSGTQGRSTSDPDDDGRGPDRSNGGADKPNGPGGVDLADQDGNNGCGNDDDFEDDNEGWCGRKPEKDKGSDYVSGAPAEVCPAGMTDTNGSAAGGCKCPEGMTDTNGTTAGGCEKTDGAVLGTGGTTTGGAAAAEEGEVLSNTAERPATVSAAAAGTAAVAAESGELFSVGSLAFTGANTMVLLAVALGLLALGYVLVRNSRRAEVDAR